MESALDVAIVSYRCEALLRACLTSLFEHPPAPPMHLHVVDNASGDGTAEMVAREFGQVQLSVNERNLGFAAATNLAIDSGSAPWVLVLNPDTRVTPGALDRLIELMQSHPDVAICGPRLLREDGSPDHAAKRSFPTPLSALGHFSGIGGRRGAPASLAAYPAPAVERGPVDAVNGAFMLIRRAALEEVGRFDEGYWMYMEDLDLCYRAREAGWLTWYEPSATAFHVKAGSAGPLRTPRLNYAFHYGMYRFYRKHYARLRNPLINLLVYGGIAARFAQRLILDSFRRRAGTERALPSGSATDSKPAA